MRQQKEFEEWVQREYPDQSLTLAAEWLYYASYTTGMVVDSWIAGRSVTGLIPADAVDWAELRKQKSYLYNNLKDEDVLEGLLNLIDHIQDEAVGLGLVPAEEVFGTNVGEDK